MSPRPDDLLSRRCMIIHGDDLGMSHSINQANFAALNAKAITSVSAMAPCPWLNDVGEFLLQHPQTDIGLHLTLTSECPSSRWRPLSSTADQEGLTDRFGFLLQETGELHAKARSIEDEVRSQILALKNVGIEPSHMDCHMMAGFGSSRLLQSYIRSAMAANILTLVPSHLRMYALKCMPAIDSLIPPVNLIYIKPSVSPNRWTQFYISAINRLPKGINVLLVHLGFDNDDLRAVRRGRSGWDAAWRQRDFDVVMSSSFQNSIAANDIQLMTWRDLAESSVRSHNASVCTQPSSGFVDMTACFF